MIVNKFTATFGKFSPKFWILVGSSFIDALGSTMVFPFFSLYITQKFNVGMTQAGVILGLFAISGFVGGIIGGALTDRFGRRGIVLFGLVFSAMSSLAFGLVDQFSVFYFLAIFVGLLSDVAGPAYNAMVADILPEEQRAEGYGILRVIRNLSWVIGPVVGAMLISSSFLLVFIADAISSLIVAAIFFRLMPETKPEDKQGEAPDSLLASFSGYIKVASDKLFFAFVLAMIFSGIAYQQIYNALPVFLRDQHGFDPSGYSFLMSANAFVVVVAQFWVTSKVSKRKPMHMLALGTFLYMIGLVMYGFVSTFPLLLSAMMIITVGEMVMMPVSQAMTANFAPEQMRGRYMAFFSLAWMVPATFGPWGAGMIMDNFNPNWLWYLCGISCFVAIIFFLMLNKPVQRRAETVSLEA
jgi:MFS family permease